MRYMRPDLLRGAGVDDFDAWAATFARTVSGVEITADGAGFQQKTRFARFQNVPEMLSTWHVFADVKTAEDLQLPRPEITVNENGVRGPRTIVVPPSQATIEYVATLAQRAEDVRTGRAEPHVDNMLKITGDGRKAALDMRLIDGADHPADTNKLEYVAGQIAADYHQHKDNRYVDPAADQLSPTPGALQIVFCDLSTPRDGWNAYDELKGQLAQRGIPREKIRFIHEAKNDADKARLFAACRSGDVSVIIGSTSRMGVGTNIQDRSCRCITSTAPGAPPTSPSATAAGYGRATRTPSSRSTGTSPRSPSTHFPGKPLPANSVSPVSSCAATVRCAASRTSAKKNSPPNKSSCSPAATHCSCTSTKPTSNSPASKACNEPTNAANSCCTPAEPASLKPRRPPHAEPTASPRRSSTRCAPPAQTSSQLKSNGHHYTDRTEAAQALTRAIENRAGRLRSGRGPLANFGQLGGLELHGELSTLADGEQVVVVRLGDLPVDGVSSERRGLAGVNGAKLLRGLEHRIANLQARRDSLLADEEHHRSTAHQAAEQLAAPSNAPTSSPRRAGAPKTSTAKSQSKPTPATPQSPNSNRTRTPHRTSPELRGRADQIPEHASTRPLRTPTNRAAPASHPRTDTRPSSLPRRRQRPQPRAPGLAHTETSSSSPRTSNSAPA